MERTELERDGFLGCFFSGTRRPDMAVIRAGDLNESMEQALESSQFLIDAGFTVLVLCLCPEGRRSAVPAEYAEHAVKWLPGAARREYPNCDDRYFRGRAVYAHLRMLHSGDSLRGGVLAVRSHDGRDGGTQTCGQFRDIPGRRGYAVHAMGRPAEGKRRSVRKGAVFKRLRAAPSAEVHI